MIAGVNSVGGIWQWREDWNNWKNLDLPSGTPYPKQLSVGSDGTMYALNVNDEIYRRVKETWEKIDGFCSQIEVANKDLVMCVN